MARPLGPHPLGNPSRAMRTLIARRIQAGISQRELARHIPARDGSGGIPQTLLSKIESGKVRLPWGFAGDYRAAIVAVLRERGGAA